MRQKQKMRERKIKRENVVCVPDIPHWKPNANKCYLFFGQWTVFILHFSLFRIEVGHEYVVYIDAAASSLYWFAPKVAVCVCVFVCAVVSAIIGTPILVQNTQILL